ncbi:MAG: hypothetical protein HY286_11110 [Planctomycetes bacterium]|nr:hypothetical protein [Planctomycetota bacterium]
MASNLPDDSSLQQPNNLDPTAQREQLLRKLNCLIAVLEAAISKVRRNQEDGNTDPDRLERIRINLENTLTICQRAKLTLEKRGMLPANLPPEVREAVGAQNLIAPRRPRHARKRKLQKTEGQMSYRDYVELSSVEEYKKFRELRPISKVDIDNHDIDSLADKLGSIDI